MTLVRKCVILVNITSEGQTEEEEDPRKDFQGDKLGR